MQGNELVIDVGDTGPGVHPEDGDRIFEAFYQGRRPQDGPVGGTGIGLSVVAECVQAHGGTVDLLRGRPTRRAFLRAPAAAARRPTSAYWRWPMVRYAAIGARHLARRLHGIRRPRHGLEPSTRRREPAADGREHARSDNLALYFSTLRDLLEGDAVVKADVFRNVAAAADAAPTTSNG